VNGHKGLPPAGHHAREKVDANAKRLYLSGSFEYVDICGWRDARQPCRQAVDSAPMFRTFMLANPWTLGIFDAL
jgi:hypothetical protein